MYYRYDTGDESAADMAVKALERAMQRAPFAMDDIDCLIAASGTMEQGLERSIGAKDGL